MDTRTKIKYWLIRKLGGVPIEQAEEFAKQRKRIRQLTSDINSVITPVVKRNLKQSVEFLKKLET